MAGLLTELQRASSMLNGLTDSGEMVPLLLAELRRICRADLAILYQELAPKHWRSADSLPAELISDSLQPFDILWAEAGNTTRLRTALEQVMERPQGLCFDHPVRAGRADFSHLRRLEVEHGDEIIASLLLPLTEQQGAVQQIIELIRFDRGEDAEPFCVDERLAASVLAQQVKTGLNRLDFRREMSDLFEALIQLIGSAIDEKSPFAGDHCRRVPVLTMVMARAVSRSESPIFRSVNFSASDLYELEVAAWLHDIGKLITPIHVTDKATKLERAFDRFDLVRTRFEILRRDLEISRLRGGGDAGDIELPESGADEDQILDDQCFLADCNRGQNGLSADEISRVQEIAERYHWIDRQGEERPILTEDEASNLMVIRGTITDAEREMINHHVVSTISMLDMLPFPEELSRVPEIAGSHHEYFSGRGFPSGLRGDQMLMQARILGFADLFESISAGSRPYKKRNSLSQALQILREMVDEGQVGPDLFRLFIEERLYEGYAVEFLSRDQIDPIDRTKLLAGLCSGR